MGDWRDRVKDPIYVRDILAPFLIKLLGSKYKAVGGEGCGTSPCMTCDAVYIIPSKFDKSSAGEVGVLLPGKDWWGFYPQPLDCEDEAYILASLRGDFASDMLKVAKWIERIMAEQLAHLNKRELERIYG